MAHPSRRLGPLTLALLCAGLAFSHVSHAADNDVIGSASIHLDNLQYRLVNLDAATAGTPTLVNASTWAGTATQALQPVADPALDSITPGISTPQSTTPLSGLSGNLLSTTSSFSAPAGTGGTGIIGAPNSLALNAVLTQGDLLSTSVHSTQGSYTYQGMYDYYSGQVGTRSVAFDATRTLTTGQQTVALSSAASDGTLHTDNLAGMPLVELTLSPHTMLLVSGTATASLSADRSNLVAGVAGVDPSTSSFDPVYGGTYYLPPGHFTADSASGNGSVSYQAQIFLVDNLDLTQAVMNASGSGLTFSSTIDYSKNGFNPFGAQVTDPDAMTFQTAVSKDWTLYIANNESTSKTVFLSATLVANAAQTMDVYHATADITFTPDALTPDPVGSIPEPGTWALMGLGLSGIALARRRRAPV